MDRMGFEQLCRDTSLALGLDDTSALGQGHTVEVDKVLFEFVFTEARPCILVLAELGRVAQEQRADVYESLLTLQLISSTQSSLHFGLNTARQTVLLCVTVPLKEQTNGAWLASMIQSLADQAAEWRTTLLAGKLQPPTGFEALCREEPAPVAHSVSA